jgi:lipoprotein-anchoring transpeptidase ErfK/SrfK
MNQADSTYDVYLRKAFNSLKTGEKSSARIWGMKAAKYNPDREEAWLILAAVATPRASISYLKRALELNPESIKARKGMHWAIQRLRSQHSLSGRIQTPENTNAISAGKTEKKSDISFFAWLLALMIIPGFVMTWFGFPKFSQALNSRNPYILEVHSLPKASSTATSTHTNTATFTLTPTHTNTQTYTPTATPTNTPTFTPTQIPTNTPTLTNTPLPPPTDEPEPTEKVIQVNRPEGVKKNERWVDVVLSRQRLFVYQGDELVEKFVVSTGISKYPTVKGIFRIYVKYKFADMRGAEYYLKDVPFVMYFFEDYGIHGTYWHNNFGTPMSHGCVNLRTEDAKWLYDYVKVGTLVRVRR